MQGLPQKVHNVSVYPYIPNAPIEVKPVGVEGKGTYTVSTLTTQIFYNLDLDVLHEERLTVGGMYYALCTTEDGKTFQTPGMYCTDAGSSPKFGLTKNVLQPHVTQAYTVDSEGPYIVISDLENVSVVENFKPPAIGSIEIISGAKGQLIATRFGTPHLMGIRVDGTSSLLHEGMSGLSVGGKESGTGKTVGYNNLKCVDAGNPSVFLQDFPGSVKTDTVQAQLSFLGLTNIAVNLVREKYPDAELYEADGVSPSGATTDVQKVNQWKFVFRLPNNSTAIIETETWGTFKPIQFIPQPWLEDVVIDWPIHMDITEAAKLLKDAGYTGEYAAVTLRQPLYPGVTEPSYIFAMTSGKYVFVGVKDKKVTPQK